MSWKINRFASCQNDIIVRDFLCAIAATNKIWLGEVQYPPSPWLDDLSVPPSTDYRDYKIWLDERRKGDVVFSPPPTDVLDRLNLGHNIWRHKGLTKVGNPCLFSTSFHKSLQFNGRLVSLSVCWQHKVYRERPQCSSCEQGGPGAKRGMGSRICVHFVQECLHACVCLCACVQLDPSLYQNSYSKQLNSLSPLLYVYRT